MYGVKQVTSVTIRDDLVSIYSKVSDPKNLIQFNRPVIPFSQLKLMRQEGTKIF